MAPFAAFPEHLPSILQLLAIDPEQWGYLTTRFETAFKKLVGATHNLKKVCQQLGYRRTPGIGACRTLLARRFPFRSRYSAADARPVNYDRAEFGLWRQKSSKHVHICACRYRD
ncbi:hypothetical protein SAMN03097708_01847 [Thiohalomonas denitrificans]|uniref:Uncharacterized protein n=1 Tax=Thiohalomonas denitrificans TaxID=415747 RepID=A0A1G5QDP3_9GAMM|nr:hypothetical protein SAMN03097708_01847 [Thiohalomonas denitrificans]